MAETANQRILLEQLFARSEEKKDKNIMAREWLFYWETKTGPEDDRCACGHRIETGITLQNSENANMIQVGRDCWKYIGELQSNGLRVVRRRQANREDPFLGDRVLAEMLADHDCAYCGHAHQEGEHSVAGIKVTKTEDYTMRAFVRHYKRIMTKKTKILPNYRIPRGLSLLERQHAYYLFYCEQTYGANRPYIMRIKRFGQLFKHYHESFPVRVI